MENVEGNGDGHHGYFANLAVNIRESLEKRNLAHLYPKVIVVVIFKKVSQISSKVYTWDWIFEHLNTWNDYGSHPGDILITTFSKIVLFFGGIQLLSIGVVSIYISKIYREVKGRPLYIIEETHNLD